MRKSSPLSWLVFISFFGSGVLLAAAVAEKFVEAGETYQSHPTAFHLRAMNMLYEGIKENSTIVVVPSTALESMELGSTAGLIALTKQLNEENEAKRIKRETEKSPRRMDRPLGPREFRIRQARPNLFVK